ncbi:MAG TPA: molybdate ABC transporter substrate-binding protein [Candidatus Acidoferrales bacterium]|nr:molybdate ABC transporter substrate-binding protein [Candidatus Acidoferrales bacterium]
MIPRSSRFTLTLWLVMLWLFGVGFAAAAPQNKTEIIVSAAISLKDALDGVTYLWATVNPNVSVKTNYGASGSLEIQIEQGAPVDVFLSAAPKQMDALEAKGLLLEGTRKDLLRNEVVLIVPVGSSLSISSFRDLARADVKHVALGEPTVVPAGQYAKEVLTNLGIWDAVNSKAVFAKDVRQVLTYVETENVDAGIVYTTDALSSPKVKVVARAPENSHSPVIYPVAAIKSSKNPSAAREFTNFLSGPQAHAVFQKYGFTFAKP